MAVIATVGGTTSNSYVTIAEANTYFTNHLKSSIWATLTTDEQRETVLTTAARHLNLLHYYGNQITLTQALKFPRLYRCFWSLPASIPQNIKYAQMEHAVDLIPSLIAGGGETKRESLQRQGVKSFSLGDLSESYIDAKVEEQALNYSNPISLFSKDALIYLSGCLKKTVRANNCLIPETSNYTNNCNC